MHNDSVPKPRPELGPVRYLVGVYKKPAHIEARTKMPALEERVVRAGIRLPVGAKAESGRRVCVLCVLKHFDVEMDVNILANQDAASFHRLIPRQTKGFAVDCTIQCKADRRALVERVGDGATAFTCENNLVRGAANRQIAFEFYVVTA